MAKSTLPLSSDDLADLKASGLTGATIRANGLRTENEALTFPYRDLSGKVNGFTRRRPHEPRVIDGKVVKYEQAKDSPVKAYLPVKSLPTLRETKDDVFVTEGEKKALALAQTGVAAIGLGGVWGWKQTGLESLIDDLAAVDWTGRDVYIVFDFDKKPTTRKNTYQAARRLARLLRAAGADEVYWIELPPADDGGKQGVDDLLVANGRRGPALFAQLVEDAQPLQAEAGNTLIDLIK